MHQIYLNALPVLGKTDKVESTLIDNLSKGQILRKLQDVVTYPDRYVLSFAESVYGSDEAQPASELITLGEYLAEKNIEVSEGDYHRLAGLVAKEYVVKYGIRPRVIARKNINGVFNKKSYGYTREESGIINKCLPGFITVSNGQVDNK